MSSQQPTDEPVYAERVYRSSMGFVSGVLLLALTVWLCGDAVLRGSGSTPWIGLAVALCVVPLIVAFTLRPAVFANEDRMRVRNPFRIIELPWATVDAVRRLLGRGTGRGFEVPALVRAGLAAGTQEGQPAADAPQRDRPS